MSTNNSLANVYLVEDSYGDIVLTKAILKTEKFKLNLFILRDGAAVIDQLEDCPSDKEPDLILLDFNLPKVDGVEVMEYLSTGPWRKIPVLIVSGSNAQVDKDQMVGLGAKHYLKKPFDPHQLMRAVQPLTNIKFESIEGEWHLLRA